MDAIYVDAESHGYFGDEEPPESVVLVGESGSTEYALADEYRWLREFLNGIAEKCGTKDCSSLVEYVRQLEGDVDELRGLVAELYQCSRQVGCDHCGDGYRSTCSVLNRMRKLGVGE